MKIETNRKYKTKNGENVTIKRIAFDKAYGIIHQSYKDGLFTIWNLNGTLVQSEMTMLCSDSGDLIEVREDWEILVDYFSANEGIIAVKHIYSVLICVGASKTDSKDILSVKLLLSDGFTKSIYIRSKEIKLAKLSDCQDFILEYLNEK